MTRINSPPTGILTESDNSEVNGFEIISTHKKEKEAGSDCKKCTRKEKVEEDHKFASYKFIAIGIMLGILMQTLMILVIMSKQHHEAQVIQKSGSPPEPQKEVLGKKMELQNKDSSPPPQPKQLSFHWVPQNRGDPIPPFAMKGGRDIYVARGSVGREIIPGKLQKGHSSVCVALGDKFGEEVALDEFEVLVDPMEKLEWAAPSKSKRLFAVPGGRNKHGVTYYICRAKHWGLGSVVVGKTVWASGICYISYGGLVYADQDFEVLTQENV